MKQQRPGVARVRVSTRARRISLRVHPGGGVEVVTPPGVSPARIEGFVDQHRQWIARRVGELSALVVDRKPVTVQLPAVGRVCTVRYEQCLTAGSRVRLEEHGEELRLSGATEDESAVSRCLQDWLMRVAARELPRALDLVALSSGLRFHKAQVRRQRTRWGSCSALGTISLNACVLFLEHEVMRYLLIHELSHTQHMNHSRRFWALVEAHEPEYRRLDRELVQGWRRVPAWVYG